LKNTLTKNRSKRLSFERRIIVYLLAVLLIVGSIIFLFARISLQNKINNYWVRHTEEVLARLDTAISLHKDVVIGTNAFVVSGYEQFLKNHEAKTTAIAEEIQKVKALTKDAPLQQGRLDSLKTLIDNYLQIRKKTIDLRRESTFSLEGETPLIYASDQILNQVKSLFHSIQQEERTKLEQRRAHFLQSARKVIWFIRLLLLVFGVSFLGAIIIVYRNTVRRNKAEAALQKSEALTRSIVEHAPVLVNIKDLDGNYMLVNNQFAITVNRNADELIGKNSRDVLPPESMEVICGADDEVKQMVAPIDFQANIPSADGLHTYIVTKFPLSDEKGKLYAIGSAFTDITPMKKAHEALEKSYQRQQRILNGLQQALSASSDLICIINENCEFVMVSDTISQLLGYTSKEVMSKKFMDFVADEDKVATEAKAKEIIEEGKTVSYFLNHYKRKDGTTIPIIWSAKWLPEDKMMYCIARNGTEKVKTAQALAQSQSQLAHAQKIAKLGSWDWDIQQNCWSCSDEIYDLLGVEKTGVKNMQETLLAAIHPDDKKMVEKVRDEALTNGKQVNIEHRIIRANGQVCYVHTKGEVRFNQAHQPIWFSGTMQDISERKQAELALQQLNQNLKKRAEELKASNAELERFAYVASHDLQEPLRMVTSFLGLLQKRIGTQLDDTSKTYIHFAIDGAERMKSLIQDLLQFSRLGTSKEAFASVDLNELMTHVLRVFDTSLKDNGAEVHVPSLPVVTGNKTQLLQLFQNLIGNALKYRSAAAPVIEIGCTEEETRWQFFVRDNGIGIDPKYFEKIFILFQRLHQKNEFGGNGIGLALCKKIVERHGGRIWVESQPDHGSTFYFTLKKLNHA
jgi:two-component system CheB/CheR fusion protein